MTDEDRRAARLVWAKEIVDSADPDSENLDVELARDLLHLDAENDSLGTENERLKAELLEARTHNLIDRDRAVAIAVKNAAMLRPSYYVEPFVPHEWVVNAIIEAGGRDA